MLINENVWNELIIHKSRFITYLYKIKSKEDFEFYLLHLKKEYKDATHICYAYILNNEMKYNDDGEPTGTAGQPILNVLKKHDLNYVACFVIRFFGGIKLGSGGLNRAYSNSCSSCLLKTSLIPFEKKYKIKLFISYQQIKKIDKIIAESIIHDKVFDQDITYILTINQKNKELLDNLQISYSILSNDF